MPPPNATPPPQDQSEQGAEAQIRFGRQQVLPLIQRVEETFDCRVISYFLDDSAALADEQMLHLYEHLRRLGKQQRLAVWLYSRGGATEVSWKFVSLLREFAQRILVLVPYRALSAATQVSLGADEIVMTEMSELGPVDPSRRHPLLPKEEVAQPGGSVKRIPLPISVQDLRHLLQFLEREIGHDKLTADSAATIYTALFEKVHPLAIGALEQSWALSQQICEQVLSTHMDPDADGDEIRALVDRLSDHYKSHLYQITRKEAKQIGLKAVDATDDQTDAMWALYVAYSRIQVAGQGELGGQPATITRLGHIDSLGGSTIGLAITNTADPTQQVSTWQSLWEAPAVGVPEAAAPPHSESQERQASSAD